MTVKRSTIVFFSLLLLTIFSATVYAESIIFGASGVNATSFWPYNNTLVRGTVTFNVTLSPSGSGALPGLNANITNITISLRHLQSGTLYVVGVNRTSNLTGYIMNNDTSTMPNGVYALNATIYNDSGLAPVSLVLGNNITIDNFAPAVIWNVYPTGNRTNNLLTFNFTAFDFNSTTAAIISTTHNLTNCSVVLDDVVVNTSTTAAQLGGLGNHTVNLSLSFTSTDKKDHAAYVACNDLARTGSQSGVVGNRNVSTTITFTTDTRGPHITIVFKDSEGNEETQFIFGTEITAVCNFSDASTGFNPATINLSFGQPNSNPLNVTATTTTRTEATYVITGDLTRQIGRYLFSCTGYDWVNFGNATNATFDIRQSGISGTSAYAIPGFKEPISKKIIGEGIVNNLGELTETGEARLIDKTGGVVVVIDDQEYEIIVKDVTENDVTLDVAGANAVMIAGDTKQFDLNTDGVNELEINLNMIYHGKADLIFKRVSVQAPPSAEEKGEESTAEKEPERVVVEEKKLGNVVVVVSTLIAVVILIFIVFSMIIRKRGRGGDGQIRFKPRDLGVNKDSASEEFYSKAASSSSSDQPPTF